MEQRKPRTNNGERKPRRNGQRRAPRREEKEFEDMTLRFVPSNANGNFTKTEVVRTGLRLHAPYELTWSCYEGGTRPCGVCGTCIDRAKAFAENGIPDPALK